MRSVSWSADRRRRSRAPGAPRRASRSSPDLPLAEIGGVLLTHFHSDHIGDLGELNLQTWAAGRPAPLPVYGGPGVEDVVLGFNQAYRHDQGYRTAHHTARVMNPDTWPMVPHP